MTEKDIIICGHGSGTPSIKNMEAYLSSRYASLANNGKHKGIIEVRRLKALTDADRQKFHDTYKTILGRNGYNQDLRDYVYTPYKNGKYYSDCSSSICATFRKIGYNVSNLNTAGIHSSNLFETVPVVIKNGHIQNPDILKVGDCLMFVGNDPDRPLQIGHVESIYEMPSTGWKKQADGSWKYLSASGIYVKNKWLKLDNRWYVFDASGKMITGWFKERNAWYYLNVDGAMLSHQWLKYKDNWYFLDSDGKMVTDCYVWSEKAKSYYYIDANGIWIESKTKKTLPGPGVKIVK